MREDIPASIAQTMHDLEAEAIVPLFEIHLRSGPVYRLSQYGQVTWLTNVYDAVPCHMTEVGVNADGSVARPRFSFANPAGVFTSAIYNGDLNRARIVRYRLLRSDLEANNDVKISEAFQVSKVLNLNREIAVLELRDVMDGPQFFLPPRTYRPPEFPHVSV